MAMRSSPDPTAVSDRSSEGLLPELVEHLRQNRTVLREEWARRITDARLRRASRASGNRGAARLRAQPV